MTTKKARTKPASPPTNTRGHLLIVEDEQDLRDLLRYNLTREGFSVDAADRGETALRMVQDRKPDLIVLDLMLPGMDGLEICRALKADEATKDIPVMILTAKGEETDMVVGLEMGADDYVTKPFSPRVVMARIKAMLRRQSGAASGEDHLSDDQATVKFGMLTISPEKHELLVGRDAVELTATEFKLMYMLARRPGRVFTRQQIIDALHEGYAAVTDRSVDVQIVSLRRKLGAATDMIQTVRGVGYRLKEI